MGSSFTPASYGLFFINITERYTAESYRFLPVIEGAHSVTF